VLGIDEGLSETAFKKAQGKRRDVGKGRTRPVYDYKSGKIRRVYEEKWD
jgi:hypothetical protein